MFNHKPAGTHDNLAEQALHSTQRAAIDALDDLSDTVQEIRHQVVPSLHHAADEASALVQRSLGAVSATSRRWRASANRAVDSGLDSIRDEPVKAALIGAIAGAALAVLIGLLRRTHQPH